MADPAKEEMDGDWSESEDEFDDDEIEDIDEDVDLEDVDDDLEEAEEFESEDELSEGDEDGDEDEDEDEDEDDEEALDELEAEELEMLTEDEASETIVPNEAAEMRAIRRAEIAMEKEEASGAGADEFVCQSCFLVKRRSQLASPRKKICKDCAA